MVQMQHYFFLACVALGYFNMVTSTGFVVNRTPLRVTAVNGFSWANCDGESLPGKIQTLTILPDPLLFPGEITVSTILNSTVALTSPVKVQITAEKEFAHEWIKIPCLDEVGSCTYDDVCDILDQLIEPGQPCPEPLHTYGIPCHCPFQSGSYYLPVTSFYVPDLPLPSMFTSGSYRVTVVLSHGGQEIGCAKITFSLGTSSSHWL
ncbi:PREDICTED: ganglioside GM2 activator-like [Nanorana parkeri]|uniref:ganglioside GM2 activator-like n=1 Tax=Nanorana parkeri TaxID=125878 RepID=UPI000853F187|nr:PREDICTED: ganglioside GM2 activator-like [Nanorana parkeri]